MQFNLTTYKTLIGKKEIVETVKKKSTQAIVYQDEKPAFFVDCFDLETEANVLMNSLVLCQKNSMNSVIESIAEKNNVNISIRDVPFVVLKKTSEIIELDLPPLPEEWLN